MASEDGDLLCWEGGGGGGTPKPTENPEECSGSMGLVTVTSALKGVFIESSG